MCPHGYTPAFCAVCTCKHRNDSLACSACIDEQIALTWNLPALQCECGAKTLGAKPYTPEHSHWCPVAQK